MLIDNIFHCSCVPLSLGYRFSRSVVFTNLVEDLYPSLPDRCKHIGIAQKETMRKDFCLQILLLRRFGVSPSLTDGTEG